MTTPALEGSALRSEIQRLFEAGLAQEHPAFLLHHVQCVDSRTGEVFQFEILTDEEYRLLEAEARTEGWHWQRELLDWWLAEDQTIALKGRQLGVTWVACGLALWYLLYKPGSDVLVYSITQDDAKEVIGRIWDMFQSTPEHLRNGVRVIKPSRDGVRPSEGIEVEHIVDGKPRVSSVMAMSSSEKAGHGRSAALVIFDEASRQEYARTTWKAVVPATGDSGGKILVISTANGMSDEQSDSGNFFHHLWINAGSEDYPRLKSRFLGWWLHPRRDQDWYDSIGLKADDKAEQYPNDPDEAFLMSGRPYFGADDMKWYAQNALAEPLFQMEWALDTDDPSRARLEKREGAPITVYRRPQKDRKYGLALDNATGHGTDYSAALVIDLHDGTPCAEMRTKRAADEVAAQVHFTGLWFNTARVMVEKQGGYGDTVIAYLRDGLHGRKPYPRLYRFRKWNRPDRPESAMYGFPMDQSTRPKVVAELAKAFRDKFWPHVTKSFLSEARTFVHRDSRPSPAAADGCNDDVVMTWGMALELYAEFGEHEHDRKKQTTKTMKLRRPKPQYPWETRRRP